MVRRNDREAKRVCAMASAYDIPVVPHGSSVYSFHLQYSQTNSPFAEFLNTSPESDKIQPLFGDMFIDEPLPKNGYVTLDANKPGFGVTMCSLKELHMHRPYPRQSPTIQEIRDRKISATPSNWTQKAKEITNITPHRSSEDLAAI